MPLTLLGDNAVNVGDGWVPYTPIALQNDRIYLLEVETVSANPEFIYSSFQARYTYPTQNSPLSANLEVVRFFYEPIRQSIEFKISPLLVPAGNVTFFVRRFPFFSQPGTLAPCNVRLALDTAIFV